MPWMIEVFRRADRSWQFSYRSQATTEAAAWKSAGEAQKADASQAHAYIPAWFDDRTYQEKLTSIHPDAPKDHGYQDYRSHLRLITDPAYTPPDPPKGPVRDPIIESIDLGGC